MEECEAGTNCRVFMQWLHASVVIVSCSFCRFCCRCFRWRCCMPRTQNFRISALVMKEICLSSSSFLFANFFRSQLQFSLQLLRVGVSFAAWVTFFSYFVIRFACQQRRRRWEFPPYNSCGTYGCECVHMCHARPPHPNPFRRCSFLCRPAPENCCSKRNCIYFGIYVWENFFAFYSPLLNLLPLDHRAWCQQTDSENKA